MRSLSPKPVVTSWDVFDTLLARFDPDPHHFLRMIESGQNVTGFVRRRLDAQAALDRLGRPYVLHDIYRRMAADGVPGREARMLLRAELSAERNQLLPIRRNLERVDPTDLIITDMYLSPEMISSLLFEIGNLHTHRPPIRSNWGKHSGTIWPIVLASYVVRRHIGNDPHADLAVPSGFNIACELVLDSQFTPWEKQLQDLGLGQLAQIQREVRLRSTPPDARPFHVAVTGPYLSILAGFSMHLVQRFGTEVEFAFLSRSADELCRVFSSMYPDIPARGLDISRRLAGDEEMARLFSDSITPSTVVVDMIGTGRSFFRFAESNGSPGRGLILFAYLDLLLGQAERKRAAGRHAEGRLSAVSTINGGNFYAFEHLLQSPYPPVAGARLDRASGGVVRTFGAPELDRTEAALVAWKSATVSEFVAVARRRGLPAVSPQALATVLEKALATIMADAAITEPFTSFVAREHMDYA
jgi:hypothetical protein